MADNFSLDTSSMQDIIVASKSLAEQMSELKNDLASIETDLLFHWAGEGRNTFEKQFHLLTNEFEDINQDIWDIYEKMVAAEGEYLQADVDIAKSEEGVKNR